jgi:hypothetical protein
MEATPILCSHITAAPDSTHWAVISLNNINFEYLCAACYANKSERLVETISPAKIARLSFVEGEHVHAICAELSKASMGARGSEMRVKNRLNLLRKHIWNKFAVRRFGFTDPEWKPCHIGAPCVREPSSLSTYSGIGYA